MIRVCSCVDSKVTPRLSEPVPAQALLDMALAASC
jgi:hypothetical protein